jgi:hypothetical protein
LLSSPEIDSEVEVSLQEVSLGDVALFDNLDEGNKGSRI